MLKKIVTIYTCEICGKGEFSETDMHRHESSHKYTVDITWKRLKKKLNCFPIYYSIIIKI